MDVFEVFKNYCPLKSVYENKKQLICFPYVAHGEPLAVYYDKETEKYSDVFFYEDNTIQKDLKKSRRIYGVNMKVSDSDDLSEDYAEEALEEEYKKVLEEYINFFKEDPHIGCCTDICPRPIPKLIEAMKRAMKRGSKLRHNEIYGRGGGWGPLRHLPKREEYRVLETEDYLYWFFPPICSEDEAKYLQMSKKTKEKRWVNIAETKVWNDIRRAKEIGTFNPDDPDLLMVKIRRNKK